MHNMIFQKVLYYLKEQQIGKTHMSSECLPCKHRIYCYFSLPMTVCQSEPAPIAAAMLQGHLPWALAPCGGLLPRAYTLLILSRLWWCCWPLLLLFLVCVWVSMSLGLPHQVYIMALRVNTGREERKEASAREGEGREEMEGLLPWPLWFSPSVC